MIGAIIPGGGIMFGFGSNKRRQVRNDTFGPSRLRNAAIAGAGMLAWRWWKNRQQSGQENVNQDRSFSETSARSAESM
jgi:hypothetical protein